MLAWMTPIIIGGAVCVARAADLSVATDFEGGSAQVVSVDQAARAIVIRPGGDAKRGWPCWWYLRVDGVQPGAALTLRVDGSQMKQADGSPLHWSWTLPDRATYSTNGHTWRHTEPGKRDGGSMTYHVEPDAETIWLAWGPPFTPADAARLVHTAAEHSPHAEAFELCKTNEGRPAPAMRITQDGRFDDANRRYIWVEARQHAWEAGSSWVCKGFVDWLLSDEEHAVSLRSMAIVYVVPIMDIDNTAVGNGGKEGLPHDHNRDWSDDPHYATVRAAQQRIAALDATGRFDLFLDLHNPGAGDKQPFYFISPREDLSAEAQANLDRFVAAGLTEISGPLKLSDKLRESGASYHKLWRYISKNWVTFHAHKHVVSVTLETAWNTPSSTTEGYLAVGMQQGRAIERYLREHTSE